MLRSFYFRLFALIAFLPGFTLPSSGATVRIVTPPAVQSGRYLPVFVECLNEEGKRDSTLQGTIILQTSNGSLSKTSIKVFRGIGSVTSRVTSASSSINLTIQGYEGSRTVSILSGMTTENHSGTLSGTNTWSPDKIHRITGTLRIPAGASLKLQSGTQVQIDEDVNVEVAGTLTVEGSGEEPVWWTSTQWGQFWGGIELTAGSQNSRIRNCFFTDGGGDQTRIFVHSNSQPVVKADHTTLVLEQCYFLDNRGKGVGTNESVNYLTDCLFARCDIGAEFRFSNTFLTDVATMFMPDEDGTASDVDNDGLYFWDIKSSGSERSALNRCLVHACEDDGIDMNRGAEVLIRHSVISKVTDKGISVSMGADLIGSRNLLINNEDIGLALKEGDRVIFENNTLYGNPRGIKIFGNGNLTLKNTIISQSSDQSLEVDSDSRWTCTYSLSDRHTLPGTGNIRSNPLLANPAQLDFTLQEGSPAINAGDPGSPADPDGTRADIGAYPYEKIVEPVTGIVINELVSRYGTALRDDKGNYTDWIELYNKNSFPVDVGGLYLTDHLSDPDFFMIPSNNPSQTTIPAKGFLILYADGEPGLGTRHLGFQLSSGGEEIGLSQKIGGESFDLDKWSFPVLETDEAYGRFPDGTGPLQKLAIPTPGSANQSQVVQYKGKLFINEFMARFPNSYPDEHGLYSDWIELYNASSEDLNLGGLYLSDNKSNPTLHRITSGLGDSTLIRSGGYFVFRADRLTQLGVNHLDFELAGAGEQVTLVQVSGSETIWIDSLSYPAQTTGISYGRASDGQPGWRLFWTPTPGRSNQITAGTGSWEDASLEFKAWPNPFGETVMMSLYSADGQPLEGIITDLAGRQVFEFRLEPDGTGLIQYSWNGCDQSGSPLPSGMYLIRISGNHVKPVQRLVIRQS